MRGPEVDTFTSTFSVDGPASASTCISIMKTHYSQLLQTETSGTCRLTYPFLLQALQLLLLHPQFHSRPDDVGIPPRR